MTPDEDLPDPTPGSAELPEDCLERFEPLGLMARGGFGLVFRARQKSLDREVVIKVLIQDSTEQVERFRAEALLTAKLDHPSIVDVIDHGVATGTSWIAYELIPGHTLREAISRGPLPVIRAIEIVRQVADGLQCAHSAGVVHRDVKPENLLETEQGQIRILDFGIALWASTDRFKTAAGMILGTPAYLSPEAIRCETVGAPADIYAMGIILYELLTGQPPFGGGLSELLGCHLRQPPPRLPPGEFPLELNDIIQRALAKDPGSRWPGARTLSQALERVKAAHPELLESTTRQDSRFPRKESGASPATRLITRPRSNRWRHVLAVAMILIVPIVLISRISFRVGPPQEIPAPGLAITYKETGKAQMTLSGIPVPGVIRVSTVNQGGLSTRVLTDSPTVALDGLMPETTYRIECLDSSDVPILQTTTRTPTVWRMVEPRSYWKESTLYMSFYVHGPQPIPSYRVILRESTSAVPQIVFERRSPDRSDTEELGETESGAPGAAWFQFEHLCQHTQRSHHLSMDLEAGWGQVRDLRIPPPELNTRDLTLINGPKTDLEEVQAVGLAASAAMTIAEQLRLPLTIEYLLKELQGQPQDLQRIQAVRGLLAVHYESSVDLALEMLNEDLKWDKKLDIVGALAKIPRKSSLDYVLKNVDDLPPWCNGAVARLVSSHGVRTALPVFESWAEGPPDSDRCVNGLIGLRILGTDDSTVLIGSALTGTNNAQIRSIAIDALVHIKSPRARRLLRESFQRSPRDLDLIWALAALQDQETRIDLQADLQGMDDLHLRHDAILALGLYPAGSDDDTLVTQISHPEPFIRRAACWSLGQRRVSKARGEILKFARSVLDLSGVGGWALGRIASSDDTPALMELGHDLIRKRNSHARPMSIDVRLVSVLWALTRIADSSRIAVLTELLPRLPPKSYPARVLNGEASEGVEAQLTWYFPFVHMIPLEVELGIGEGLNCSAVGSMVAGPSGVSGDYLGLNQPEAHPIQPILATRDGDYPAGDASLIVAEHPTQVYLRNINESQSAQGCRSTEVDGSAWIRIWR